MYELDENKNPCYAAEGKTAAPISQHWKHNTSFIFTAFYTRFNGLGQNSIFTF